MTVREIINRDWTGMIATTITFMLAGMAIYLIIDSRYAIHDSSIRSEILLHQIRDNHADILQNRKQLLILKERIKSSDETGIIKRE